MTSKERKIYTEWKQNMSAQGEAITNAFEEMRNLYKAQSGENAPYCFDFCFEYLMASSDRSIRSRAMTIFRDYHHADGLKEAWEDLEHGLVNIR